jgi:hypothetical protein
LGGGGRVSETVSLNWFEGAEVNPVSAREGGNESCRGGIEPGRGNIFTPEGCDGGGAKTMVEGALSGLGGTTLFVIKKKILLD